LVCPSEVTKGLFCIVFFNIAAYDKRVEVEEHLPEQKVLKDKSAVTIDSHNSLELRVVVFSLPGWLLFTFFSNQIHAVLAKSVQVNTLLIFRKKFNKNDVDPIGQLIRPL